MKLDTPSKKPSAGCCRFGIFLVSSVVGKTNKKLRESGRNLIRVCLDSWLCYLLTQLPGKKINLENSQLLAQCFFGMFDKRLPNKRIRLWEKKQSGEWKHLHPNLMETAPPDGRCGDAPVASLLGTRQTSPKFRTQSASEQLFFSFKTTNSRLYGQSRGCYTSRQTHSRREVSFSFIHTSSSKRLK